MNFIVIGDGVHLYAIGRLVNRLGPSTQHIHALYRMEAWPVDLWLAN